MQLPLVACFPIVVHKHCIFIQRSSNRMISFLLPFLTEQTVKLLQIVHFAWVGDFTCLDAGPSVVTTESLNLRYPHRPINDRIFCSFCFMLLCHEACLFSSQWGEFLYIFLAASHQSCFTCSGLTY